MRFYRRANTTQFSASGKTREAVIRQLLKQKQQSGLKHFPAVYRRQPHLRRIQTARQKPFDADKAVFL